MVELEAFLAGINGNRNGANGSNSFHQLLLITLGDIHESNIPCSLLAGVVVALVINTLIRVALLGINS